MPPRSIHFIGRQDFLDDIIDRLLSGEHRFISIEGLPGAGKTTLAIEIANSKRIREHFEHGVLWAGLGPVPDPMRVLGGWAGALTKDKDVSGLATPEERAQAVKSAIGQRRMLLVIDDAWQPEVASLFRCGGPDCCHLFTTRDKAIARGFSGATQTITVPVLENEPSYELLAAYAPEICEAEPETARQLASSVGGLPLALELLGGYLAAPERAYFPGLSSDAIAELNDPKRRLDLAHKRLGALGSGTMTLQETITLSLDGLTDQAIAAFYSLGAFAPKPADFDREAALAVTVAGPKVLALLVARNLIEVREERLAVHQVVADAARAKVDNAAIARHANYYLSKFEEYRSFPWRCSAIYEQIKRAWECLPEDVSLLEWVWALRAHQSGEGLWQDYLDSALRGLKVAVEYGRKSDEGALLANIGVANHALRQREQAANYCQQAMTVLEQSDDRAAFAINVNNLGMIYQALGQHEKATAYFQQALSLRQAAGDDFGYSQTLSDLALLYQDLGQSDKARECSLQATLKGMDAEPSTSRVDEIYPFTGEQDWEQKPHFLKYVNTLVQRDDAYAGLEGVVSLAVRRDKDTVFYWSAVFSEGKKLRVQYLDYVPRDANVIFLVSEEGAADMLDGKFPPKLDIAGNKDLFNQFIDRYFLNGQSETGEVRLVQEKYPEAEAVFTKEIAWGRDDADVYRWRARAREAQGNDDGAQEDYKAAIDRGEEDPYVLFKRAAALMRLEKYKEAETLYSAAIDHGKQDASDYYERGFARFLMGDDPGAETDFTKAIAQGQDDADIYYWRAITRQKQRQFAEAEADLTDAIERGRNDAVVYFNRADLRFAQDNFYAAEADFTKAIDNSNDNAETYFMRGITRIFQEHYADAERDLSSAIEKGKDDAEVYCERGTARLFAMDYVNAAADFNAALDRGQDDAQIRQNRACANTRLGQLDEAQQDCERARELAPNDPFTFARFGELSLARGNYDEAIGHYRSAVDAAPGTGWHCELGLALLLAGRTDEAQAAYEQGLNTDSTSEAQGALDELDFWTTRKASEPNAVDGIRRLILKRLTDLNSKASMSDTGKSSQN